MNSQQATLNPSPNPTRRSSINSRLSFAVSHAETEDGILDVPPGEVLIEEEIAEIKRYEVCDACDACYCMIDN